MNKANPDYATVFEGSEDTPLGIRGLHLDPCRHFIQVETVLRIVDKMAQLKLNTLHLHLSDDQSIPLELTSVPEIQSPVRYSIADQERIAAACKQHSIQIIPEIDIPGHARAFLSYFRPNVRPERRMGIVTPEMITIERDLPVILKIYEELAERFSARMIHMGGDEARRYKRFPELVGLVCDWAAKRGLEVVAWDDVLSELDTIPDNLIIQWWRYRAPKKINEARVIMSHGYYLDHADDPFTCYNRSLQKGKEVLGGIACMWTELVTDRTIEATVFPSMYMIAHRWWTYPEREIHQPVLLRKLCEEFGYPETEHDSWRTRRWVGFYKDDPRSTSSVTVDDVLDRDQDLYPVFSRSLVIAADTLYRCLNEDAVPTDEEREIVLKLGRDCYDTDLSYVFVVVRGRKSALRKLLKKRPKALLYKNGLDVAIRRALRGPYV